VPCDLADSVAKHVILKFSDQFSAKIIIYTKDPDGVKHMKKYKNIIKSVAPNYQLLITEINLVLDSIKQEFNRDLEFIDHAKINANKSIIKKFENNEKAVYSCKIVLGRGWIFKKKRLFVMTNKFMYIYKSSTIKRKILPSKLDAVTLSKTNKTELVIHIEDQPDVHFSDKLIDSILEVLQFIHFI